MIEIGLRPLAAPTARDAPWAADSRSDGAVAAGLAVGDRGQLGPDLPLKRRAATIEWDVEAPKTPGEVGVELILRTVEMVAATMRYAVEPHASGPIVRPEYGDEPLIDSPLASRRPTGDATVAAYQTLWTSRAERAPNACGICIGDFDLRSIVVPENPSA